MRGQKEIVVTSVSVPVSVSPCNLLSQYTPRDEFRAHFDHAMRSALRGHARIQAGIADLAETRYRVGLIYTHVQRCPKHVSRRVFDDRTGSGLFFFQRESGSRTH